MWIQPLEGAFTINQFRCEAIGGSRPAAFPPIYPPFTPLPKGRVHLERSVAKRKIILNAVKDNVGAAFRLLPSNEL